MQLGRGRPRVQRQIGVDGPTPLGSVAAALSDAFSDGSLVGASTAGEFTERGDAKSSVAVFALEGDYKVYTGIGHHLRRRRREVSIRGAGRLAATDARLPALYRASTA